MGSEPTGPKDPTTEARPVHAPDLAPAATYAVVVTAGPDAGKRVVLDGTQAAPLLVGSGPSCELRLSDRQVSRRHLSLILAERRILARDLGSTNGTLVSGVLVLEAVLRGGETVRLGETELRVEVVAPATTVSIPPRKSFGRLLGASAEMRRLYPLCERLAATDVPVVIEGETGTGKELLAESIHEEGPRASAPFVVFDCTAVPANLIESDLFGHERGAFTGATAARRGVFEQANGGTLLIDEIGDLDLALQAKLLRAIERREIRRVGGEGIIKVDVRILCATRRNLDQEVQAQRFRDDLFHRLCVARIELPPLRRRRGDIRLLARAICRDLGGNEARLDEGLLARWETDPWPGNVRELRNAVMRRLALGDLAAAGASGPSEEPGKPRGESTSLGFLEETIAADLTYTASRQRLLDEFEERYVERVLARHGGNVMRAAAASGIARRHFQRIKARTGKGG